MKRNLSSLVGVSAMLAATSCSDSSLEAQPRLGEVALSMKGAASDLNEISAEYSEMVRSVVKEPLLEEEGGSISSEDEMRILHQRIENLMGKEIPKELKDTSPTDEAGRLERRIALKRWFSQN